VSTTTAVKPGVFRRERSATRSSWSRLAMGDYGRGDESGAVIGQRTLALSRRLGGTDDEREDPCHSPLSRNAMRCNDFANVDDLPGGVRVFVCEMSFPASGQLFAGRSTRAEGRRGYWWMGVQGQGGTALEGHL
jgi:hypothetical protein